MAKARAGPGLVLQSGSARIERKLVESEEQMVRVERRMSGAVAVLRGGSAGRDMPGLGGSLQNSVSEANPLMVGNRDGLGFIGVAAARRDTEPAWGSGPVVRGQKAAVCLTTPQGAAFKMVVVVLRRRLYHRKPKRVG